MAICKYNENGKKCSKKAHFGYDGDEKATFCGIHKVDMMVDIIHKKCEKCKRRPTFGYMDKSASHCALHKSNDMIDLMHKKCVLCIIRPTYGFFEDKTPTYCNEHKLNGMIDITNIKCIMCSKRATYGYSDNRPKYCKTHKTDDMKDIVHKKCLVCDKIPHFGFIDDSKPTYCAEHKLDFMTDIKHKKCTSCNLFMVAKKNNNLCSYCNPTKKLNRKTREIKVVNYLSEHQYNFEHNKSVGFVCGNYRPDIKIATLTHSIIIEIDEEQHIWYNKQCELSRMFNIYQAEGLSCVFLRYNPDTFKINNIKQTVSAEKRLEILKSQIDFWIKNIPTKPLICIRLFYDNNDDCFLSNLDIDEEYDNLILSLN
jgi:hypothetical protein